MTDRRDFIKKAGSLAAATLAISAIPRSASALFTSPLVAPPPAMDAAVKELLLEAINAARLAGASFADARISRFQQNFVFTREFGDVVMPTIKARDFNFTSISEAV